MIVGHISSRWVSTDSAGVPHGGSFGDVESFEKSLNEHGMKLAWSRMWNCFYIYTQRGYKCVTQLMCWDWGRDKPLPLTQDLLSYLLSLWNDYSRHTGQSLVMARKQRKKDREEKRKAETKQKYEDMQSTVIDEVLRPRKIISIPKGSIAYG